MYICYIQVASIYTNESWADNYNLDSIQNRFSLNSLVSQQLCLKSKQNVEIHEYPMS